MLQKKDYVDRRDKKKISELVFRSSILAAAAAHRLGKSEAARSLYMNAYLENELLALKALRDRLPAKSDVTLFEKVHIPAYKVARTTETAPGHLEITVETQLENPEFYLLQMICGDLLRKQQATRSDLKAMKVWILNNSAPAADGRWDEEGDEIRVRLYNALEPG